MTTDTREGPPTDEPTAENWRDELGRTGDWWGQLTHDEQIAVLERARERLGWWRYNWTFWRLRRDTRRMRRLIEEHLATHGKGRTP